MSAEVIPRAYKSTRVSFPHSRTCSPSFATACLFGSRIPALCFNLLEPPRADEANSEYASKLRDLALRLGLPSDYVDTIQ